VCRGEFIRVRNIEVFLEAVNNSSACNKVLRKQFLKHNTIDMIRTGGYSGNVNYSKKALMLINREQKDGCRMMHGRNGCEDRLPELTPCARRNFVAVTGIDILLYRFGI
jgi:hypothetical protein